jgi:DNA end-binding protein Ku
MTDRYEARLRAVIEANLKGEGIAPEPEEEERDNVVDLMAALKRSLGQDAAALARKAPVRNAPAKKPARRRAWAPRPSRFSGPILRSCSAPPPPCP